MVTTTIIKQRGAAEVERHVPLENQEFRQQTDDGDVDSTDHGQAGQISFDIARGLLTRTNTGDESTALLQVIRSFPWC